MDAGRRKAMLPSMREHRSHPRVHSRYAAMLGLHGRGAALSLVVLLLTASGCSAVRDQIAPEATAAPAAPAAPTPEPQTDSGDGADLFDEGTPEMVKVTSEAKTRGEFLVPRFCRPNAVGLARDGDGFLLVIRTEADIPAADDPPALRYGVILLHHELSLGMFDPKDGADLGAQYLHTRQYQTPDRPSNQVVRLGEGDERPVENVDVDVQGNEIRIAVPDVGDDAEDIEEWGLRFSCVLRHPVDGIYFPTTRVPAEEFARLKLDGSLE